MGKKYIVGCAGEYVNSRFCVENEIVIGRNPQNCQIIFSANAKGISGVHCKVHVSGGNIFVTDMNSTNGTFLEDGTRLSPGVAVQLENMQKFYLGNRQNIFGVEAVNDQQSQPVQQPQSQPVQQLQSQPQPQSQPQSMPYPEKRKWIAVGSIVAIIAVVIIAGGVITSMSRSNAGAKAEAERERENAERARDEAEQKQRILEEEQNKAEQAQRALEEEQNKSKLEKTFDAIDAWLD